MLGGWKETVTTLHSVKRAGHHEISVDGGLREDGLKRTVLIESKICIISVGVSDSFTTLISGKDTIRFHVQYLRESGHIQCISVVESAGQSTPELCLSDVFCVTIALMLYGLSISPFMDCPLVHRDGTLSSYMYTLIYTTFHPLCPFLLSYHKSPIPKTSCCIVALTEYPLSNPTVVRLFCIASLYCNAQVSTIST